MRTRRVELPRPFGHYPLKVACLPVPPRAHEISSSGGTNLTRESLISKVNFRQNSLLHQQGLKPQTLPPGNNTSILPKNPPVSVGAGLKPSTSLCRGRRQKLGSSPTKDLAKESGSFLYDLPATESNSPVNMPPAYLVVQRCCRSWLQRSNRILHSRRSHGIYRIFSNGWVAKKYHSSR